MDDSLQQAIAVTIIVLAVALELWRRYRKKKSGKAGCDGCKTDTSKNSNTETPLKFYQRK
jgi:hypothetical protein